MKLGQKLDNQQLRILIGLRLGAIICIAHTFIFILCKKSGFRSLKYLFKKISLANDIPVGFNCSIAVLLPSVIVIPCRRIDLFLPETGGYVYVSLVVTILTVFKTVL